MRVSAVLAVFRVSLANTIDPDYAINMTVYHLNPSSAGAIPVNMDTGDALGDLYFYLDEFHLPIECADPRPNGQKDFDCANPERSGDLVVTKVVMEMDQRTTGYALCNLCETGVDPVTGRSCAVGEYVCDCHGGQLCNPKLVGVESVAAEFMKDLPSEECATALNSTCGEAQLNSKQACDGCMSDNWDLGLKQVCRGQDWGGFCSNTACTGAPLDAWKCWHQNLARKTGGSWFSHLAAGQCREGAEGLCGWRVLETATVAEDCLRSSVIANVEAEDPACFQACGAQRNTSSACWIGCFFDTILGPEARSRDAPDAIAGMSPEALQRGWTDAFLPVEQGGCPVLPDVSTTTTTSTAESALCQDHPGCVAVGLAPFDGLCCPVADGTRLACCDADGWIV